MNLPTEPIEVEPTTGTVMAFLTQAEWQNLLEFRKTYELQRVIRVLAYWEKNPLEKIL